MKILLKKSDKNSTKGPVQFSFLQKIYVVDIFMSHTKKNNFEDDKNRREVAIGESIILIVKIN